MLRIMLTNQAEENLGMIPYGAFRRQVADAIELLARYPELGRPAAYFEGLKLYRASSKHYLILFRVVESNRTLAVIAILAGHGYNLNLVEPFAWKGRDPNKEITKRIAEQSKKARAKLKRERDAEAKAFAKLLDEELSRGNK